MKLKQLILMLVLMPLMTLASTEVVNGITWTYVVDNGKAQVGTGSSSGRAISTSTKGAITIPSTLGGCPVTSIGARAFDGCSGLTSMTIPSSVTSIEISAFCDCSGLTSVTIPDGVMSIGEAAFDGCSGLTSMAIPESVTSIGVNAFYGTPFYNNQPDGMVILGRVLYKYKGECPSSVTIPSSVTSIGEYAFYGCSGLTSVTIPSSVTSIGEDAFYGTSFYNNQPDGMVILGRVLYKYKGECPSSVTIPSSVTSIGEYAFRGCSGLTSVTIPSSVTSIGDCAFRGCSGLTSVTIPSSVTSIGMYAFCDCSGLKSFVVDVSNPNYCSINGLLCSKDGKTLIAGVNGNVTIPSSVTSIGYGAFDGCSGLTSVTIPSSVTSIGMYAFSGCSGLTSVTIPSGVTSIGRWAFRGCIGLTSVAIPLSVTSIGESAFYYCGGLTSVTIPSSVTSIGDMAFYGCSGLTSVTIPSSVTSIGYGAFDGCSGLKTVYVDDSDLDRVKALLTGSVDVSGLSFVEKKADGGPYKEVVDGIEWTFVVSGGKAQIGVGDSWIGSQAIPSSTTGAITIPAVLGGCPVTSIGMGAFFACESITGIVIPDGVTSIAAGAFQACSVLTSVTIPPSMTNIGERAFLDCEGLLSVTIPSSVKSIMEGAFCGCEKLGNIVVASDNRNYKSFDDCLLNKDGTLLIRGPSKDSVTIPSSVTNIVEYAFDGCSALTSVTIPSSVTRIGDGAFFGCSGLTSLTIPSSVTSIGDFVFADCAKLSNIVVAADNPNYKSVNDFLLSKDGVELIRGPSKDSVTIPSSVTDIGTEAFSGCGLLTSVTIPSSVTSIGSYAFYDCPADCQFIVEYGDSERVLSLLKGSYSGREYRIIELLPPINELLPNFTWDDADVENEKLVVDTDAPSSAGCSIRMSADDDSETWVEMVVTGDVRVAFAWKASCESPMLDDKDELCFFDRLEFRVDGEVIDAVAGETNWSSRTFNVWGEGEHRLRWAYVKDASDSEGEDCGWIAEIQIAPYETIQFAMGGEESGSLPVALLGFAGEEVTIPSADLTWPRHTFVGWSDGEMVYNAGDMLAIPTGGAVLTAVWEEKHLAVPEISAPDIIDQGEAMVTISAEEGASIYYTLDENDPSESSTLYTGPFVVKATCTIKAIAIKEDYFDSAIVEKAITRLPYTFGEYLGMADQEFTTSGDAEWGRAQKDGRYVLQSGAIGDSKSSVLSTIFTGSGRLNFVYAVSSEAKKGIIADGLALYVDDFETKLMWDGGEVDWKEVNFDIVGAGDHIVRWVYSKNAQNFAGDDCAWLDEVRWTPDDMGAGEIVVDDPDGHIILPDGKDITEVQVKVISNGYDIFPYLKLPKAVNGIIDLSQAEVKVEIVEAVLDPEKGAKIELNAENPILTTSATIPGLTYTLHEGATLESMQSGDTKVGDGEPWTPEIKVKGGKSAFYSISVGK